MSSSVCLTAALHSDNSCDKKAAAVTPVIVAARQIRH
jgi:hypothetical protein